MIPLIHEDEVVNGQIIYLLYYHGRLNISF